MKFILGQKKGMTQIFGENGNVTPVTIIEAKPCPIVRTKTQDSKDGYNAAVIGLPGKKKLGKRELGQTRGLGNLQYLKEFRIDESDTLSLSHGDTITVDAFNVGDKVKVTGFSKGKGFQGVVKRHGFHGHNSTHGTKDQVRTSGSVGPCEPARVFPGVRMPGHMGDAQVSIKNLSVIKVDKDNNTIYVKGAVPGARNGLLIITCDGKLELKKNTEPTNEVQDAEAATPTETAENQELTTENNQ